MVKYEKTFMLTLDKTECHVSVSLIPNEGMYSSEKLCPASLIFHTTKILLIATEAKQNTKFSFSQAWREAEAQWAVIGGRSTLPGSVLEPGFGVSPRAWMISTSSCPFRSCKPISTSPKPKCQNRQNTFKTIRLWANKMLTNNLCVMPTMSCKEL